MDPTRRLRNATAIACLATALGHLAPAAAVDLDLADTPLFLSQAAQPLALLVMGRDHKLYYEAYNDASDLDGDGQLDTGYKPAQIDYFGYFDSHKCYVYDTGNQRFAPAAEALDKKCAGQWSGDFLNYVTTARIDAMRKVLYGGRRTVDTAALTVLERSHIPQDAHSWGKEYASLAVDGYLISDYAPLAAPLSGQRHLFANTTLLKSGNGEPLLRMLPNSAYRIWEWVSIERPVAGDKCLHGGSGPSCESLGGAAWEVVPASAFASLQHTTYDTSDSDIRTPDNHAEYESLVADHATADNRFGSAPAAEINGSGNPFGTDDKYLTIFEDS